jgi:mannosyltransferase OCH1-like enzyme
MFIKKIAFLFLFIRNVIGLQYIPKKIFQIVASKDNLNSHIIKNIEYIKNINSDWEYKLLDDIDIEEYILNNYNKEYLQIYKKINPDYGAARADFFRYLLMYKEGGVYLDIKSSMSVSLNEIIKENDEYILSHWITKPQKWIIDNENGEFQQWHIICKPNHPFLKKTIENVIDNILNYDIYRHGVGKWYGVLKVTGPIVYTLSIIPLLKDHNYTLYYTNTDLNLVYSIFDHMEHQNILYKDKKHYSELRTPVVF